MNLRQTALGGDTGAMLRARRVFLERGFFRPISDAINAIVIDHLVRLASSGRLHGHEAIADVGCGEGYYLRRLARTLDSTPLRGMSLVGLDASKYAARLTAAGLPGIRCAVVDVRQGLFLRPRSAAVLLNVFAPRNPPAFAEALVPGGLSLVVIPRPEHMKEVRDLLPALDIPPWKQTRVEEQFRPHLTVQCVQDVSYSVRLDANAQRAWIEMGPSAWHITPGQVAGLQCVDEITTEVACTLMSLVKGSRNVEK